MSIAEPKYRSRWARDRHYKDIRVTPRDVALFQLLTRYRYLRKNFIDAFMGGNPYAMKTRLGELFRAGYLRRPDQQRHYFNANYRPMIYELDQAGRAFLESRGIAPSPMAVFRHVHTEFGHLVMLCDVLANIELGAREAACEIIPAEAVSFPVAIRDQINGTIRTSNAPVTPDAVFTVRYPSGKVLHFALEVDCGTEPLRRSNLEQTSYHRKLLQYRAVLETGAFRGLGFSHLWIMHVTNTASRMRSIMELTGASKSNLFRHMACLGDFAPDPKPDPSFFGFWEREGHPAFECKQ